MPLCWPPTAFGDMPKALLPVGNRPLLSYSLEMLEAAGFTEIILVVPGADAAARIGAWVDEAFSQRLKVVVASVPEDYGSADALRSIAHRIKADDFLLVSGDLVCNLDLTEIVALHRIKAAQVTSTLMAVAKPAGGAPEPPKKAAKPGGAPLDFIGLDPPNKRLLFFHRGSKEGAAEELSIRRSMLRKTGQMRLTTDLQDAQLHVFSRHVLEVLKLKPQFKSIAEHVLPFMVEQQSLHIPDAHTPGASLPAGSGPCTYYQVDASRFYVINVNCLQAYVDVNRDICGDQFHLSGYPLSTHQNYVEPSVEIGTKSVVGAQCIVGRQSVLGDKCGIKRSVIGMHCRLGNNVKIVNSVLMHHVTVEDNCHIQNSVVGANALMGERTSIKDCFVGASFQMGQGEDHRGEILAKS
eukprot:jgi/Mesvir1/21812/Mv04200-RA.2